jgi:hypothetical protein
METTAKWRPVVAEETDVICVCWTLADGTTYYEDYRIPPAEVRRARTMERKWRDEGVDPHAGVGSSREG